MNGKRKISLISIEPRCRHVQRPEKMEQSLPIEAIVIVAAAK